MGFELIIKDIHIKKHKLNSEYKYKHKLLEASAIPKKRMWIKDVNYYPAIKKNENELRQPQKNIFENLATSINLTLKQKSQNKF